jgi:uncharacterized membrane protein YheB (UPF0754 family)
MYRIDKSLVTNLVAAAVLAAGFLIPWHPEYFKNTGIFALSGALTNWLAVHMLFDKVPFLYGSGVIQNQFDRFKVGIKDLIMRQFFTVDNINRFIELEESHGDRLLDLDAVLDSIDYNKLYQKLVDAIMESSFGGMLGMFGGVDALEPLREPFIEKIRSYLKEMTSSESFNRLLKDNLKDRQISDDMLSFVESLVDRRLNELTPAMVKEIVQTMIRKHLGWLVVWGGVFGGLIGLIYTVM